MRKIGILSCPRLLTHVESPVLLLRLEPHVPPRQHSTASRNLSPSSPQLSPSSNTSETGPPPNPRSLPIKWPTNGIRSLPSPLLSRATITAPRRSFSWRSVCDTSGTSGGESRRLMDGAGLTLTGMFSLSTLPIPSYMWERDRRRLEGRGRRSGWGSVEGREGAQCGKIRLTRRQISQLLRRRFWRFRRVRVWREYICEVRERE